MNKRKRIQQKAQAPHTPIRDKDHPNENYWNSVANGWHEDTKPPKMRMKYTTLMNNLKIINVVM